MGSWRERENNRVVVSSEAAMLILNKPIRPTFLGFYQATLRQAVTHHVCGIPWRVRVCKGARAAQ